jgi:hypothetical protein
VYVVNFRRGLYIHTTTRIPLDDNSMDRDTSCVEERKPRAHRVSNCKWVVRNESGVEVNCGSLYKPNPEEEDCISMEPMTESRLENAPSVCVKSLYPHLRGVELLCGHKFCAVNLLWCWVLSKMCCPVCRREFPENAALPADISGLRGEDRELRMLRKKISDLKRQEEREAEMDVLRLAGEEYLTQLEVTSLLQHPGQFWIRLSFFGVDGGRLQNEHRFLPLNRMLVSVGRARTNSEMPRTRMQVQRADLRSLGHVLRGLEQEVHSVEAEIVLGHHESMVGRQSGTSLSENIRFFIPRVERNDVGWNIRPASDSAIAEFTYHGSEGLAHSTLSHPIDECDGVLNIEFEHNLASMENRQVKITNLFFECDTLGLMGLAAAAQFAESEGEVDVELGFTFERISGSGAGGARSGGGDAVGENARIQNVRGTRFFVVMRR